MFKSRSSGKMAKNSFSNWMANRSSEDSSSAEGNESNSTTTTEWFTAFSFAGQFALIQDNLTSQMSLLTGSLPEAGPLSEAFRSRLTYAVYLLMASAGFGLLAIIVGLPTIVLRPSKFVICITLCTTLGAASVIVLQKPSVFVSNLLKGGVKSSLPVLLLLLSSLITLYVTIFMRKYIFVVAGGSLQVSAMMYYLSSFIPGGSRGLKILSTTALLIIKTALAPFIFVIKRAISGIMRNLFS